MDKIIVSEKIPIHNATSVLIVDTSGDVRLLFRNLLKKSDYRVIEAADVKEGLELFDRDRPDIVLTSLLPPEADYFTLIADLDDRYGKIPVIVISGADTLSNAIEAVHLGAWDYVITPPRDARELEITITRALERVRLLDENYRYRQHLEELAQAQTRMVRESEERFSQLFMQQEDAIILFRLDSFEIVDANPAAAELYGFSRNELMCTFPWPFVGEGHKKLQESLFVSLNRNSRFDLFGVSHLRKDGTPVVVSMRGKLVTLMDDKVVYCSIRDITEKIRLEEDVRDTQTKLIQAHKMASLGMLASGIAHEINNPNNFILFNSTLLAETWQAVLEVLDDQAAEQGDFYLAGRRFSEVREEVLRLIAGLSEGARRIQAIVETLKGFVREDPGGAVADVDINRTVQVAMTLLSHETRKYTGDVSMELADNLPSVRGKNQQIEQVVINLVTNALHAVAGNAGGVRIATSCDPAEKVVIISVQDDGIGMTKEELERVGEPFFTARSAEGGTGLGVSISLSIIKGHDGTLVYASEPGRGTTATVRLPVSGCLANEVNNEGAPL